MGKFVSIFRPGHDESLNGHPGADWLSFISNPGTVFKFSAIAVIFMLIRAVYLAPRGFDLTDESYYLMFIADPWAYNLEAMLFGFFYHPLYVLTAGDITYLRLANLGLTWLLFYGLAITLVEKMELESATPCQRGLAALLLTAPVQLLLNLYGMRFTPSYNSLCGQGLAVSLWALLLIGHQWRLRAFSGWVLLGFGGSMVFMGKSSSALLLALGAALYIWAVHREKWPWIFLAVAVALATLAAFAFMASGSLEKFVSDYKLALQFMSVAGGTHTYKELLLKFLYRPNLPVPIWLFFCAIAGLSYVYINRRTAGKRIYDLLFDSFWLALVALAIVWISGFSPAPPRLFALGLLAAPVGVLLALWSRREWALSFQGFRPGLLKFALLLFFMPYIFAFGSANNMFHQASAAAVFWLMAAVTLMAAQPDRDKITAAFKVMASASIFFVCTLTRFAEEYPYRQSQPLWRQNKLIISQAAGREFIVADDMHDYLTALQKIAAEAGFKKGQCLIDMTGHSPGAAYFLGARAPGRPWLAGGYPGSRSWITLDLDRLPPAELDGCWLLLEPEGPRPNDPAWLLKYGLDVEAMAEVGTVMAPYMGESFRQILLKPDN